MATTSRSAGARRNAIVGKVRPADPFELIRWLARSQPDPRKALAELVQNSIDAGAKRVEIVRKRERGIPSLLIRDDGEGVIPELDRTEALKYLATHIGHSRKRNLTPEQRRTQMMQGKYGIGLLGFWAMGKVLEIRSKVAGETPAVLRLFEDSPRYEIEAMRSRLNLEARFTEVAVLELHRPAFVSFAGRRIADYLAAELRGQLLSRQVQVIVHDRVARGRAPKTLEVVPIQFPGRRLELPEVWPIAGYSPMRVEIYIAADGENGNGTSVSIASSGTVVHDSVTDFESADFRRPPWTDPRLSGIVDFADFQVPPGSRRGIIPDAAAYAFAGALRTLEPILTDQIGQVDQHRAATMEAGLLRQLARAFRDVPRLAPEYGFFEVRDRQATVTGAASDTEGEANTAGSSGGPISEGGAGAEAPPGEVVAEPGAADDDGVGGGHDDPTPLLSGVRLHNVEIQPASARVERLGRRRLRAQAIDASSIPIRSGVEYRWRCAAGGAIEGSGRQVEFVAGPAIGTAEIRVIAVQGDDSCEAMATLEIVEPAGGERGKSAGIPEPVFVAAGNADWRSRMVGTTWEVNSVHPDFVAAAETPKRKLRYLASLLAKEIVLHSFPGPSFGPALERLVSVLAITERRIN